DPAVPTAGRRPRTGGGRGGAGEPVAGPRPAHRRLRGGVRRPPGRTGGECAVHRVRHGRAVPGRRDARTGARRRGGDALGQLRGRRERRGHRGRPPGVLRRRPAHAESRAGGRRRGRHPADEGGRGPALRRRPRRRGPDRRLLPRAGDRAGRGLRLLGGVVGGRPAGRHVRRRGHVELRRGQGAHHRRRRHALRPGRRADRAGPAAGLPRTGPPERAERGPGAQAVVEPGRGRAGAAGHRQRPHRRHRLGAAVPARRAGRPAAGDRRALRPGAGRHGRAAHPAAAARRPGQHALLLLGPVRQRVPGRGGCRAAGGRDLHDLPVRAAARGAAVRRDRPAAAHRGTGPRDPVPPAAPRPVRRRRAHRGGDATRTGGRRHREPL
ncbi:MAG: hypothetical protein AVDCRST_MAG41-1872, partial [uncultured Corynebacteriales bacterium]